MLRSMKRASDLGTDLRGQPLEEPAATLIASIAEAVVQAVLPVLPELDCLRDDSEAAPEGWERNEAVAELAGELGDALLERRPALDDRALP